MEEYLDDPSVDKITARRNVEGMLKNEISNMPDQGKNIDIGDLTPEEIAHLNRVSGEDYSKITGNKAIITPHQQAHQIYSRMLNFGKDTQMDADQFTSSLKKAVGGNTLTGKGPQDNNKGGILMANNNSRAFWKPEKGGADLRTFFPERANKDDLNRAPVAPPKAVSKNKKRNQKAEKRAKQEALLMAQKAGLR